MMILAFMKAQTTLGSRNALSPTIHQVV